MTAVSALARYSQLLSLSPARRLLVSSLVARLPLGVSSLAVLLFVRAHAGSFAAPGLAVGAYSLATAAASPVQGALVDRLGPPRVLLPGAVGQALLFVGLVVCGAVGAPVGVLIVLAAGAGALLPPFSACARMLWSEIVAEGSLREAAYALDAVSQETIWILGPLLVGILVEVRSPAAAVLFSAAVTLVGAGLFVVQPLVRRARPAGLGAGRGGALASGGLRVLLCSIFLTGTAWGALAVGFPALASHAGSHGEAGLLLALTSVGSMAGGLAYGARRWPLALSVRYPLLLLTLAILAAPLMRLTSLPGAFALAVLAGIPWAPVMSCQYSLVRQVARAGTVTEAFTWNTAAFVGGMATGSALAGVLDERVGVPAAFALLSASAGLAALVATAAREWLTRRGG